MYDFKWALLLTGTPIQNNVRELFSLLHLMNPDKYDSWEDFSDEFCGGGTVCKTAEQADKIRSLLRPILLRRMKEDVETLPTKEEVRFLSPCPCSSLAVTFG